MPEKIKKPTKKTTNKPTKQTIKKDIEKKQIIEVLKKNLGNISNACDQVGISRWKFYDWIEKDEQFKKDYEETLERGIDFVESCLFREIKEGNVTGMIFYLKTKAKHRGYVEKVEKQNNDEDLLEGFKQIAKALKGENA